MIFNLSADLQFGFGSNRSSNTQAFAKKRKFSPVSIGVCEPGPGMRVVSACGTMTASPAFEYGVYIIYYIYVHAVQYFVFGGVVAVG